MSNSRNRYIDFIKVLFCAIVLLYHTKLLAGGYLAVCGFFTLSGYLTSFSILKKDNFRIKDFYFKRLTRLYRPMVIIVFISIGVVSLLKEVYWVSLEPETTSVLLGYNNFWQIGANMDYFAKHSDSPFMHLWYIAILLQLTVIAPLIILPLKRIGEAKGMKASAIISLIISAALCGLFIWFNQNKEMMAAYYNTASRAFSFFFGIAAAFVSLLFSEKNIKASTNCFWVLIVLQIVMFVLVPADSKYYATAMVLTTILTCICVVCIDKNEKDTEKISVDKAVTYISDISYELYLVQYPLIFIGQYLIPGLNKWVMGLVVIVCSIVCALLLHLCLHTKKSKLAVCIIILLCSFGCYKYVVAEDHSEEIAHLETQLAKNREMLQIHQADYQMRAQIEKDNWQKQLSKFDTSDENIAKTVKEMPINSVGDSVMLGASTALYNVFSNLYCDAEVSRSGWGAPQILRDWANQGLIGDAVIIALGTNGDCPRSVKEEIMDICGDAEVFWVGVTNDKQVHVNAGLKKFTDEYDNAHFIDWPAEARNHPSYFVSDGIHMENSGNAAYADFIYKSICEVFKESADRRKAIAIAEHDDAEKKKLSLWGDDLLLNAYEKIETNYEVCDMHLYQDFDEDQLITDLKTAIDNNELTYRLVFVFVNKYGNSYSKLLDLCKDNKICIVKTKESKEVVLLEEYENVKVVDFTSILSKHKEYILADGKHLSDEGNIALGKLISECLSQ